MIHWPKIKVSAGMRVVHQVVLGENTVCIVRGMIQRIRCRTGGVREIAIVVLFAWSLIKKVATHAQCLSIKKWMLIEDNGQFSRTTAKWRVENGFGANSWVHLFRFALYCGTIDIAGWHFRVVASVLILLLHSWDIVNTMMMSWSGKTSKKKEQFSLVLFHAQSTY